LTNSQEIIANGVDPSGEISKDKCMLGGVGGGGFRPFVYRLAQEHKLRGRTRRLSGNKNLSGSFLNN